MYATGTKIRARLPFVLGIGMAIPWRLPGRHRRTPETRHVDGPGEAQVRRLHPRDRRYYATSVRDLRESWVDPASARRAVKEQLKAAGTRHGEGRCCEAREKPVLIEWWARGAKKCLTSGQDHACE